MNYVFNCKISLSKKIRSLIGDGNANIILNITDIKDGIGDGVLSIDSSCNNKNNASEIINSETCIMITPIAISSSFDNMKQSVTNIFDTKISKHNGRTPLTKLAVTTPPETRHDISTAFKTEEENGIPEEFSDLNNKNVKKFILSFEDLISSINKAKLKTSNIDFSTITDRRQKAVLQEQAEMMEAIDEDAYIVNTKYQSVSINDLGIQLQLNIPFNLNRISAKKLYASKDFEKLLNSGYVQLISPDKVDSYVKKASNELVSYGLKTYDRVEDASEDVFDGGPETLNLNNEDLSSNTEEEKLINTTNINKSVNSATKHANSGVTLSGGIKRVDGNVRKTVYTSNNGVTKQIETNRVESDSLQSPQVVKPRTTVKKLFE